MSKLGHDKLFSFLECYLKEVICSSTKVADLTRFSDFIDPVYWAVIAALHYDGLVEYVRFRKSSRSRDYSHYIFGRHPSLTTVPLRRVNSKREVDKTAREIVRIMDLKKEVPDLDQDDIQFFEYIIAELLDNAVDHGRSFAVCCAQKFPNIREIEIVSVDRGVGFYKTISRSYSVTNDAEAIELAVQKGVTGSGMKVYEHSPKNAGYGLYVISHMMRDSDGKMWIISGKAYYDVINNRCYTLHKNPWQGSIILLRFNLDKFYNRVASLGFRTYFDLLIMEDYMQDEEDDSFPW